MSGTLIAAAIVLTGFVSVIYNQYIETKNETVRKAQANKLK
jgi:hypothetical protein